MRSAVIAGLLVGACGEARGNNRGENTAEKPGITAPVEPTMTAEIASPTPTEVPTLIPEVTATWEPTPTPEKFREGDEVTGWLRVDEAGVIAMDFTPVTFTPENTIRFNNHEGNLALATWEDKYNNEVYQIHDGQHLWRDLPAEALRRFIQEQGVGEAEQMAKLIGSEFTFSQDGQESRWYVAALQKVEHEDVEVFAADAWSVVDRLVEFAVRDGKPVGFETAKVGWGKIFVFCGRTDDLSQSDWYKYSRYALLLLPVR